MTSVDRFFDRGLKLGHLRLLTLFASLGQIRLVAARLNVTQPAVSKQVAELEAGLGGRVFARVGNRLQFTPLGEALLKHAREVLQQLDQARHEVDALSSGISGTVAVGAVATVMPVIALELTLQIKKRAPRVNIAFFEATSDRLFPMLDAGELDLVFSRIGPPPAMTGLSGEPVLDDPLVVVCGQQHPLALRSVVAPPDLLGMPWILPPREAPSFAVLSEWFDRHGLVQAEGSVQSISPALNEALLKRCPLLGLMPYSMATQPSNRQEIKVLGFADAWFLPTVWAYRQAAVVNPAVSRVALESVVATRDVFERTKQRNGAE